MGSPQNYPMSKVTPSIEFDSFSGKLSRKSRIVLRTRNGQTHAYALDNPFRGTASAEQGATRTSFGEAVRQASVILKAPTPACRVGKALCGLPQAFPLPCPDARKSQAEQPFLFHSPRLHHLHPEGRGMKNIQPANRKSHPKMQINLHISKNYCTFAPKFVKQHKLYKNVLL